MPYNGEERRSGSGRRKDDGFCALHSEIRRGDLASFDDINDRLKDCFSFFENYVTKWTAGIITTVAFGFLSAIVIFAGMQVHSLSSSIDKIDRNMARITNRTNDIFFRQSRTATIQETLGKEIQKIQAVQEKQIVSQSNLKTDVEIIKRNVEQIQVEKSRTID